MNVLVTVSGTIPNDLDAQIASGRRPRADYREIAAACGGADVLDWAEAGSSGRLTRLVGRIAGNDVMLAWACWRRRHRYDAIFSDGEQVGLPYALLAWAARRRPRHVMIAHRLSAPKKARLHKALRLGSRIDAVVVYSSEQRRVVTDELGYSPDRCVLTSFMVDTEFWRPEHVVTARGPRPTICAVGQELRDYPTLVAAVRDLDIDVRIAAESPWSKRADTSAGLDLPDHVRARGYDLLELRQLYADAALVVVPLQQNDFQAGITTILEAMSMGRAVICSRTDGQTDIVVDGESGMYVPVRDASALRVAIVRLLADPALASSLGEHGRQWVRAHADIEAYAAMIADVIAGRR